jgi:predicted nicotinamide N-methyase
MIGSAIAQRVKRALPFQQQLRTLKRSVFRYKSDPKNDDGLLRNAVEMVGAIVSSGTSIRGKTVVEIGTGWMPILPVVFSMAGAKTVVTLDQTRYSDNRLRRYSDEFARHNLDHALIDTGVDRRLFHNPTAAIEYRAPADFHDLPPRTADIIVSRTVLEHIRPDELLALLFHAREVLRPAGVMAHWIDMSDHRQHFKKKLSRIDFLRYSDAEWERAVKNHKCYQNRMRMSDYAALFREAGWNTSVAKSEKSGQASSDLRTERLVPDTKYASRDIDDLATISMLALLRQ